MTPPSPESRSGPHTRLPGALREHMRGAVRFDTGARAQYASDASNYRHVPIGVVIPRDADDVRAGLGVCRAADVPVLPRGAGTSLAGQTCNVAVVFDFTPHMNRILEIDPRRRIARVEPGVVLDRLRAEAAAFDLTFGPDPSTHSRCSLGGMIGNNSCGTHSLYSGKTVDNVEELRVLLYDGLELTVGPTPPQAVDAIVQAGGRRGAIYAALRSLVDRHAAAIRAEFPAIPRRVSGYNLDQLLPENGFNVARALVGSEGTCVTVLEATLRLVVNHRYRTLIGLGFRDVYAAAECVPGILGFVPIGLEGFDGAIVDGLRLKGAPNLELLPEGRGFLLVEFGSDDRDELAGHARAFLDWAARIDHPPSAVLYSDADARAVWKIREAGPRAAGAGLGKGPRWEGWDDSAVAPEKLARYLRDLRRLLDEYQYQGAYYGHFGHGCIHMQISFDLQSRPGIEKYGEFVERAAELVVSYGGSISGEHGDGQSRGALLPKMFSPAMMQALRDFKAIWDPANRMNPGKLVDARPPTADLRLGADYQPREVSTHFSFREDGGSFAKASLRCVGIGECRKQDAGTMCPSYMATLDEEHSTRGRARMLFEALRGDVVREGWQDESVKQALDLCLSCKACKSECPTNVDIATYKAEFLSHYYERHWRPLHAHAFGRIDRWARLASRAPALVNRINQSPLFNVLIKRALEVSPHRELPRFALVTFRQWARRADVPSTSDAGVRDDPRRVVLWSDTFSNHFHPEIGQAAVHVLSAAGLQPVVPPGDLCCGRPLYDFGMLDEARRYLRRVLDALEPEIDNGAPVVVLEPSCASVFRDELPNLFPDDARAARLARQVVSLGALLNRTAQFKPPRLSRQALLLEHCHHRTGTGRNETAHLLRRMGVEVESPDMGCCGMAGPFGFSARRFPVSRAIAERKWVPTVRQAPSGWVLVADGFSCREQLRQLAGRKALHLAELLASALRPSDAGPSL